MKVIAFVHFTAQMSGVEFSTLYLAQNLDRARWAPLVVCPAEGALTEQCRAAGIAVAIVPRPRIFSTSVRVAGRPRLNPLALAANSAALLAGARPLARFLRARPPALVVTKGLPVHFYGGLAARWAGVPCVWHVQDRVSERAGPLFPWTLALAGRTLAHAIIADAESIARQLQTFVPRERIAVVWNGVDTNTFSPQVDGAAVRAEWGIGADELLIGVAGRLTPWKGQHVLIQALARLAEQFPHARVALVGAALFDTDEYARALQVQVARLGLDQRVLFTGFRWDMPQVFAALDIVAHTALEKDSTPLAVASALAAGKPIVCTRVEGTAELFEDGVNGLLVPPGAVNALAGKLALLLRDAGLRQRLGAAARLFAERELTVAQYARRCESVFDRVGAKH